MYVLVERIGMGSRIILDRGWMARIGVDEIGTQVVEVEIEGGALVIRCVPAEERAAALESAETVRNEHERRWKEAVRERMPTPTTVVPERKVDPGEA